MQRLAMRIQSSYVASRTSVRTATEVIEEHKNLLWLLGTGSSALAGWAVYTMRRLHYARIEEEMTQIQGMLQGVEQRAQQEQEERNRVAATTPMSPIHASLVLAPAVASAFLLGYAAGRTTSSYRWHRQLRVGDGLRGAERGRRIYVAVVPEMLFESGLVAKELERAITADAGRHGGGAACATAGGASGARVGGARARSDADGWWAARWHQCTAAAASWLRLRPKASPGVIEGVPPPMQALPAPMPERVATRSVGELRPDEHRGLSRQSEQLWQ